MRNFLFVLVMYCEFSLDYMTLYYDKLIYNESNDHVCNFSPPLMSFSLVRR